MGHKCKGYTGRGQHHGPHLVETVRKNHQGMCIAPPVRRHILNLTFDSNADVRNFRQVAKLANVPESVVYAVVRESRGSVDPTEARRAA